MMECANIQKLLSDYSVGGLSKKKRESVKQHVDDCPSCARELMSLDKTASLLDSMPQEEPPDFLWEAVRREIIQQERPQANQPIFQRVFGWMWTKRKRCEGVKPLHLFPAFAASLAILILVASIVYFAVLNQPSESTFYPEIEQQTLSYWSNPLADRAALGVLVTNASLEGGDYETFR